MRVSSYRDYDNPTADIAVYTTDRLESKRGRSPEQTAVEYLSHAFELGTVNYEIRYDFGAVSDIPARESVCGPQFSDYWRPRVNNSAIPYVAADSNVLLVDGRGGGCGAVGGNVCTVGGTPLSTISGYTLHGNQLGHTAAFHLLHEVGHNIGHPHRPHGGYGFMSDGKWWNTPTVGPNATDNDCGEHIEKRDRPSESMPYLFWHWCAVDDAQLADGDPDPPCPDHYPPTYEGRSPPHAARLTRPPDRAGCNRNGDENGNG